MSGQPHWLMPLRNGASAMQVAHHCIDHNSHSVPDEKAGPGLGIVVVLPVGDLPVAPLDLADAPVELPSRDGLAPPLLGDGQIVRVRAQAAAVLVAGAAG